MSYSQLYTLATDSVFQQQVLVALMNQCAVVLTESPAVAGHQLRAALAVRVVSDPQKFQSQVAFALITQGGITPVTVPSTVPDANVQAAVAAVWNALSGYFPN